MFLGPRAAWLKGLGSEPLPHMSGCLYIASCFQGLPDPFLKDGRKDRRAGMRGLPPSRCPVSTRPSFSTLALTRMAAATSARRSCSPLWSGCVGLPFLLHVYILMGPALHANDCIPHSSMGCRVPCGLPRTLRCSLRPLLIGLEPPPNAALARFLLVLFPVFSCSPDYR